MRPVADRKPSRVKRRTSGFGDRVRRNTGKALAGGGGQCARRLDADAAKQNRLRADDGDVGARETEDAERAAGMPGFAARRWRRALIHVVAENNCRCGLIGLG